LLKKAAILDLVVILKFAITQFWDNPPITRTTCLVLCRH
jgi:hypothetical protein